MSGEDIRSITADLANDLLLGPGEVALIDLREPGPFSEGHPLFAVPCPFSELETSIGALLPRRTVRVLLIDGGDGIAEEAACLLAAMGYTDLSVVEGGAPGWAAAGLTLYKGVHVFSKTLGELAELALHPRPLAPDTLAEWQTSGRDFLFFDTRPAAEHAQMTVPGAICLPNGELVHRIDSLPAKAPVVLTCAGRTRGIVGAASLSLIDPAREVWWLEDGTQGWRLAGHDLVWNNAPAVLREADRKATRARAADFMEDHGIAEIGADRVETMLADPDCTTFVFDVRDPSETRADPVPCARAAPVVTLLQATDRFIGPRRANVVLVDDFGLRAALAAYWLRAMGFGVFVCRIDTNLRALPTVAVPNRAPVPVAGIDGMQALGDVAAGRSLLVDVRSSSEHAAGTVAGAIWSHRARLSDLPQGKVLCLIGDGTPRADLVAATLMDRGRSDVRLVEGGLPALRAAGAGIVPGRAMDLSEAVDVISFARGRHEGDAAASRLYLSWEKGLVDQLSPAERAQFAI
jgi:rhodanese-related sulfurtransferase